MTARGVKLAAGNILIGLLAMVFLVVAWACMTNGWGTNAIEFVVGLVLVFVGIPLLLFVDESA